jgi:VanZ family protein
LGLTLVPLAIRIPVTAGDKAMHFLAFAVLTVWFLGVFHTRFTLQVALALAGYGVLIEVLQSFTSYRSADIYDVLSDVVGISAGWLLASAGLRRWCGRVEAFLGVSPP